MEIHAYDYGAVRNDKTQAQIVCGLIATHNPSACSLPSGYMVTALGNRCIFSDHGAPVPRVISERRNESGRCTLQVVRYPDGSCVRFTWNARDGYRYTSEGAKQ